MPEDSVRRRVVYTGRVQGVGFRATTRELAAAWPVVGWVRNRDDGAVELLVAGPSEGVDGFLAAIRERFHNHILRVTIEQPPTDAGPPLTRFSVRP
jgi:acylphosphatase